MININSNNILKGWDRNTIAEKIAEIRSDSFENIAEATTRNAQNFFKI